MEHSEIELMAHGYHPAHIGKDCEEVIVWLATQLLATQKQRDALAAENAALKSAISEHSEGFTVCPCCGTEHDSSHDDVCRTINETPATDAYLNCVRSGVIGDLIGVLENSGAFTISDAFTVIEDFAAQPRAGKDGE